MSNGDVRRVSLKDIQMVQNLIERCLQLYMSRSEVVSTLLNDANVEPGFTELVWQKLETENQEFFKAYHLRLIVKDHILRFNQLLERQSQLMHQMRPNSSIPQLNGSRIQQAYQVPHPTVSTIKPEHMHQPMTATPNLAYTNGSNFVSGNVILPQDSNPIMMHGMNGGMIKSEDVYSGGPPFMFAPERNLLEPSTAVGEGSSSRFNGVDSNSEPLNEAVLDQEMNSFGFLGQIPRNFSLSDLTADFSNSTDILETYTGSAFLGTDENFLDLQIRGEHQDIRRMDTISEGLSYEDFGSDS